MPQRDIEQPFHKRPGASTAWSAMDDEDLLAALDVGMAELDIAIFLERKVDEVRRRVAELRRGQARCPAAGRPLASPKKHDAHSHPLHPPHPRCTVLLPDDKEPTP